MGRATSGGNVRQLLATVGRQISFLSTHSFHMSILTTWSQRCVYLAGGEPKSYLGLQPLAPMNLIPKQLILREPTTRVMYLHFVLQAGPPAPKHQVLAIAAMTIAQLLGQCELSKGIL